MLLLIIFISILIYPIDNLIKGSLSPNTESETSVDTTLQRPLKKDGTVVNTVDILMSLFLGQPAVIEGQFIIAEGNSDHLFRPSDFLKEEVVQLGEAETKDTKNDDKVSHSYDTINPSLPHIRIIQGHFIYYNNDSDEHLFDEEEDFTKHDTILN
ncbi:unnamed protein product [Adineta steineri]|uniref:Uncharacterized protein n=1 Tax=Adineta steineri TaxID=433720 RepID=A0A814AQ92_9BILA|nr:unnamed protein product [Adineta steineri]CAF0916849.1 unnamed protein product [Adineta steineri]